MAEKRVYFFGGGKAEGNAKMKELLGGKGANLAEMSSLGIPVPAGFTITTEVCTHFMKTGGKSGHDSWNTHILITEGPMSQSPYTIDVKQMDRIP